MKIVQIGANRGSDDLTQIINFNQPEILILVEPLKIHNETLNNSYSWVDNLKIENVVISNSKDKELEFFYHLDDGPGFEVSSLDIKHIYERHTHMNKERITSIKVKNTTINELFDKYNLKKIDILFIDAEGSDDEIIKSINFDDYDIQKIYFENIHIKDKNIYNFLIGKNYKITEKTGSNNWTSLAEKNN